MGNSNITAMKRLGIYAFYDSEGIVDRYVVHFLTAVRPLIDHLVVVCNGIVSDAGMDALRMCSDNVIVRDNFGYDAMAVRCVLVDKYGWDKISKYDYIVVMNDTFYGPFWPLADIFAEMEKRCADLWGMLARIQNPVQNIHSTAIGSFFYVMSQKLIVNKQWQQFWESMDGTDWCFSEAVSEYEDKLIPECEKAGCVWDAYLRSDRQNSERKQLSFFDYVNLGYDLIKYHNFPFLKRKPMADFLDYNISDASARRNAIEFLKNETNYDVDMIWENIIRKYDISEIKKCLQLTKIFAEDKTIRTEYCFDNIIVVLRIEQVHWLLDYVSLINKLNATLSVCIFTGNEEIYADLNKEFGKEAPNVQLNKFLNIRHLLKSIREYIKDKNLVLFIDDSGCFNDNQVLISSRTFQKMIETCMWKDDAYIEMVVEEFRKEKRLGAGILPKPYHGEYIQTMQNSWNKESSFAVIRNLMQQQSCHTVLTEKNDCINCYPVFWTRSSILAECCDALLKSDEPLTEEIVDIIGRLVPYIAQRQGFYTEEFMSVECAEKNYSNLQTIIQRILKKELQYGLRLSEYGDLKYINLKAFCLKYERIYIYGAGMWGKRILTLINQMGISNVSGFIVTDGQEHSRRVENYSVYELHEINSEDDIGIIVAVSNTKQIAINRKLSERGLRNIYNLHD